jgi:hypothetical protein
MSIQPPLAVIGNRRSYSQFGQLPGVMPCLSALFLSCSICFALNIGRASNVNYAKADQNEDDGQH